MKVIKAIVYTASVWGMCYTWFTGHTVWFWLPALTWIIVAACDLGNALSPWMDPWFDPTISKKGTNGRNR